MSQWTQRLTCSLDRLPLLERELEREALPYIGASPVGEITAPDLLAVVRRVEVRGHLRKAHTVFQVCGRVLRYAVATGRAERDVSSDLRGALLPVKTKHFAATTDPREVGPLLRQLDTCSGTLPVRCALRLAPPATCARAVPRRAVGRTSRTQPRERVPVAISTHLIWTTLSGPRSVVLRNDV